MNSQPNSVDHHSFKIIFSNLRCKINLSETALFAFVIRIGKTSSKYTQKKEIHDAILEFDNILEVPIDHSFLPQQSHRKEKCEIMLYKFRLNREKQSKELVGMASVAISNVMFQVESKKLRLTNSFDKEAFVQCKMKIQLGQADVLSHYPSQVSSFNVRSQENSINNELTGSRAKQMTEATPSKNHVRIGLITSNSKKSLREASSEKGKGDNSFLDMLIRTDNESSPIMPTDTIKSELIIKKQQSRVRIEQFVSSNTEIEQNHNKLMEMCKQLQEQNQSLKATIQNLENQALNQSMISQRSASSQNPYIPRPGGISKRSPMIKKNATIIITPSFSKLQPNGPVLTEDLLNQANEKQIHTKVKGSKKGQIIRAQGSRLNNSQDNEYERSPYFQQRGSRVTEETSKFSQQQIDMPLHLTFAGERLTQRNRFSVTSVLQVKYLPSVNQVNHEIRSTGLNKSIAHSSISEVQRRNCSSYTKFNGKKKYQIVGVIKNHDDSVINMSGLDQDFDENHKREGGSIIVGKTLAWDKNDEKSFHFHNSKQNSFNGIKAKGAQNEKNFLDFLKENPFLKNTKEALQIPTPKASQGNLPNSQRLLHEIKKQNFPQYDPEGQLRSSLTLQELELKTEEKFRKNERKLIISNTKISQENRKLKEERRILDIEIKQKKELSHGEFEYLKIEISRLKNQIDQSVKIKQQSESRCQQFTKKLTTLQEQNAKLKKDLKQQKLKYEYYFKMSNINDDKEKQRENMMPSEKGMNSKKSVAKLLSETSSPGDVSKTLSKNDRSMTFISNFNKEDGPKMIKHDKSLKKVDFSVDKNNEGHIDASSVKKIQQNKQDSSKQPTSSTAVSKLKMHIKSTIPKSPMNGVLSQIQSPANSIASANLATLMTGLIGTRQTIVEGQKSNKYFSRK